MSGPGGWCLFLRIMAVVSVAKGLYHWAQVTGFIGGEEEAFENQPMAWQTATVYFAVIELVAAVGLWLATPWGAVVWLTTVVSMAVIELMFPGIYGGSLTVVGVRGRDARGLSGARLDGRARTAAIACSLPTCANPHACGKCDAAAKDFPKIFAVTFRVTLKRFRSHLLRGRFEFERSCFRMRQRVRDEA